MKFRVLTTRISVAESSIEAKTIEDAAHAIRLLNAGDSDENAVATGFILQPQRGKARTYSNLETMNVLRIEAAEPPKMDAASVLKHFVGRLEKSLSIVEHLAYSCVTPEDLARDQETDVETILATRDYEDEYDAFMKFIVFARRALDEPDVLIDEVLDE